MNREPLQSRLLYSFAYDAAREILEVQFHDQNGKVYQYKNFGAVAAKDFMEAKSKGKYFLHFIKGRYPYERIEEANEDKPKDYVSREAPQEQDNIGGRNED